MGVDGEGLGEDVSKHFLCRYPSEGEVTVQVEFMQVGASDAEVAGAGVMGVGATLGDGASVVLVDRVGLGEGGAKINKETFEPNTVHARGFVGDDFAFAGGEGDVVLFTCVPHKGSLVGFP